MDSIPTIYPDRTNEGNAYNTADFDDIRELFSEGKRGEIEWLDKIGRSREVLIGGLKEGQRGIVVGAGSNTPEWKGKGWSTMDIDESFQADIIGDANFIGDYVPPESQDFIYAENLTMHPENGVLPERLLDGSYQALKKGGILIVKTCDVINDDRASIPTVDKFGLMMHETGFDTTVEVHEYHTYPDDFDTSNIIGEARVFYYAQKE